MPLDLSICWDYVLDEVKVRLQQILPVGGLGKTGESFDGVKLQRRLAEELSAADKVQRRLELEAAQLGFCFTHDKHECGGGVFLHFYILFK